MHKFVRNLMTEWRKLKLPVADETIIIGVSGGADSVSLVLALHNLKTHQKLKLNFIIAHFNHNLRGKESDDDAQFVKELGKNLELEFVTNVENSNLEDQKGNLEQNARNVRYDFLNSIAVKYKAYAVLTAHTRNDQAETFLFNLIRGSGLDGLAGMKVIRTQNNSKISLIRPLLNWALRNDTEEFCRFNNIDFRLDTMNDDLKFSRVQIRQEIIPALQKINPKVIETLSQTAGILGETAEELKKNEINLSENLSQNELKLLSKTKRMNVLRDWLSCQRGNLREIDLKHLQAIESILFSSKSGRIIELPNGEKVIKKAGNIYFEKSAVEKS